jgi:hypothetical protein
VKGNDLARTVAQDLLAKGKASHQQRAEGGWLPFADQVCVAQKLAAQPRQSEQGRAILFNEGETS